jgi:hypothetical protein
VRATRAIGARTGYTEPVIDYALDALFSSVTAAALRATIASELGALEALERFVERPGRPAVRYAPVPLVAIVSSRSTIGVALPALAFALCAGSRVMVKDRSDGLIGAFAASVRDERPDLGERIEASAWDAREGDAAARLARADTVVAYGRALALAAIRAGLEPDARFVGYGPRTSIGYVARTALADEAAARAVARGAARDALLYDGEGCLSPHALFVESGAPVTPRAFARLLGAAFDETAVEFPAGAPDLDADAAAYRRAALFRASQGTGDVFAGVVAPHLVAFDPPRDEPPPLLRRTLGVYPVDGPADALAYIARHALPLEAVGFAGPLDDEACAFAVAAGAARAAALGDLQRPPLGGDHGGAGRILPFVRAIYRG